MKKILFYLLLILLAFGLVGCNHPTPKDTQSSSGNTTTPPPSAPPEPAPIDLQKYTPYFMFVQNSDVSLAEFHLTETENLKKLPQEWQNNVSIIEEGIPDILWQWGDMELNARYVSTTSTQFGLARYEYTRRYKIEGYGTIGFDQKTGTWVTLDFISSKEIDKDPPAEKLTQDECRAIAQQYINDYVATFAPEINLDEYTFVDMGLQSITKHKYYTFVYDKYVDGYRFLYDSIICCVTEYGSVIRFKKGDDFRELEENFCAIDWDTINANLARTAEEIIRQNPSWSFTYEIGQGYFEKTKEGTFIYRGGLVLHFGPIKSAYLVFLIPM